MKIAAWRSPAEEARMKRARTTRLNTINIGLLSAVPPRAFLPRSARVPLLFASSGFGSFLARQNNAAALADLLELKIECVSVGERVAQNDVALELAEVDEAIGGRLIYAALLFNWSTVEQFARCVQEARSHSDRLRAAALVDESRSRGRAEETRCLCPR